MLMLTLTIALYLLHSAIGLIVMVVLILIGVAMRRNIFWVSH